MAGTGRPFTRAAHVMVRPVLVRRGTLLFLREFLDLCRPPGGFPNTGPGGTCKDRSTRTIDGKPAKQSRMKRSRGQTLAFVNIDIVPSILDESLDGLTAQAQTKACRKTDVLESEDAAAISWRYICPVKAMPEGKAKLRLAQNWFVHRLDAMSVGKGETAPCLGLVCITRDS